MSLVESPVIAFIATTDADRAKTFYRDVVGLRLLSDEPFALVFDANGTMLRVQKVNQIQPQQFTVLGWSVSDIYAAIREFTARGLTMVHFEGIPQDEFGVWTPDDATHIAWFRDPDGNLLSLTQFASKSAE